MGADIHAHTEVKINGIWHHYGQPNIGRNYNLFAKMAGVRNSGIVPISDPRGLPEDITFITWYDYTNLWIEDGHSMSWLSGSEITKLDEWYKSFYDKEYRYIEEQFGYLFGNGWEIDDNYDADRLPGLEDSRIVFWFDN